MNRLQNHFNFVVSYDIIFKDNFINVMQTPRIDKIVLNSGVGQKAIVNKKYLVYILLGLELISGQKAKITRAKKSVDKFKLRKNIPIGAQVTLRKKALYLFLEQLAFILPKFENLNELYQKLRQQQKKNYNKEFHPSPLLISNSPAEAATLNNFFHKSLPLWDTGINKKKIGVLRWSTAFGLNDFFLFDQVPYDKLDSLSGLGFDIIFCSNRITYKSRVNKPSYLLSSWQMPL